MRSEERRSGERQILLFGVRTNVGKSAFSSTPKVLRILAQGWRGFASLPWVNGGEYLKATQAKPESPTS
jgi:hypothetical protein